MTRTNTLAYLCWLLSTKKIGTWRSQHSIFFTTYEKTQLASVLHYDRFGRLARNKHSSLLGPFVGYGENKVLWIWPMYSSLVFAWTFSKSNDKCFNGPIWNYWASISNVWLGQIASLSNGFGAMLRSFYRLILQDNGSQ